MILTGLGIGYPHLQWMMSNFTPLRLLLGLLTYFFVVQGLNGIEIMGPLEAVEGQNIEIFCTTQQGVDANSLTFQYNGSMSSDRITTLFSNSTQHNLLFGPTSKDDNGVPVACSFAEFSSTTEVLNIFYNEFVAFVSSENLVDNVVTVMVGGNLTLFLNISANPDVPTLNRNSSGIVSSALTISSVALLFTQVSRTDEGNYSISVSNTAGTSSFSFELMVVEPGTTMTTSNIATTGSAIATNVQYVSLCSLLLFVISMLHFL